MVGFRFPLRTQVDTANKSRLNKLNGPEHEYNAADYNGYDEDGMRIPIARMESILDRETLAPKSTRLKVMIFFLTEHR